MTDSAHSLRARMAGYPSALDLERQDRRRHRAEPAQQSLVHDSATESSTKCTSRVWIRPARATWASSSPTATTFSPRRSGTARSKADPSSRASRVSTDSIPTIRGVIGFTRKSSAIPTATWFCRGCALKPCRANSPTIACSRCSSPHLANCGNGNTGWIGDYKGYPMFFAEHGGATLACASTAPWKKMSVGFVGMSDGWQDLSQHFQMNRAIHARRERQHRFHRRD